MTKETTEEKLLVIEQVSFEELTPEQQEYQPDNGCGKEFADYLIIKYKGAIIRIESDAMESEDVRFCRDLSWIKDAIEQAYELGRSEVINEQMP